MVCAFAVAGRTCLGASSYVLSLGCLVSARELLYQSKPSIEVSEATTITSGCNLAFRCVRRHFDLRVAGGDAWWRDGSPPPLRPNTDLPQSPASHASNSARGRSQTPRTRAVSRREGFSARMTDGGLGQLRGNSAPGRQTACKPRGSWAATDESKRGVRGTKRGLLRRNASAPNRRSRAPVAIRWRYRAPRSARPRLRPRLDREQRACGRHPRPPSMTRT
jgi:hypothetical protein